MVVSCPKCGHKLWAPKVSGTETFDVWVFFEDGEHSDTYAKRVGLCPKCRAWLTEGGGWPTSSVREGRQKGNGDL